MIKKHLGIILAVIVAATAVAIVLPMVVNAITKKEIAVCMQTATSKQKAAVMAAKDIYKKDTAAAKKNKAALKLAQNNYTKALNEAKKTFNKDSLACKKPPVVVKTPTRDDFGCWPPSCLVIPDPKSIQACEDWKAEKTVAWGDCNYFSGQPACQKLCELETSVPVEKTVANATTPCSTDSLKRQFTNTPYYTGPLVDDHFHMPQMQKLTSGHVDAPVIDQDVPRRDVACLFSNRDRVKNVFAFYGIPSNVKDKSIEIARDIEKRYPGTISHFIELVSFPGYPVVPSQIDEVLDKNKGLFKGYGELSLYLPHYNGVKPNDPAMKELYTIADKNNLIVMMHPIEGQEQAIEEVLRDYPNVQFLFHAAERLSSVSMFHDTFLEKYPNAHYSVDIDIFGEDSSGRPLLAISGSKQSFIDKFKQNWQTTLNQKVAFWKSKIEKHPDQFLWGTDRGEYAWHYDQDINALLEEYSRAFIGQLDPAVQEKYAYKNADSLLQKR